MAFFSSSKTSGFESKTDSASTGFDPFLATWMTRDAVARTTTTTTTSACDVADDDESKRKDKDSESEIRELFKIFDKNHDNTISSGELGKMLRCMGMDVAEADVANIMKELDKNGNGKIEYREFKIFMQEEMRRSEESPQEQERAIRMAFQVFDKNGDGVIDAKELKSAMKKLGEPLSDKEFSDMMREADVDKDGKINYDEFIKIWLESSNK